MRRSLLQALKARSSAGSIGIRPAKDLDMITAQSTFKTPYHSLYAHTTGDGTVLCISEQHFTAKQ